MTCVQKLTRRDCERDLGIDRRITLKMDYRETSCQRIHVVEDGVERGVLVNNVMNSLGSGQEFV
jgi:hypothetical protein